MHTSKATMGLQAKLRRSLKLLRYLLPSVLILYIVVFLLGLVPELQTSITYTTDAFESPTEVSRTDCNPRGWCDPIYESDNGEYKLTLCYNGTLLPSRSAATQTINERRIRKSGRNKFLTYEDLMNIPDKDWRHDFDWRVFNLFPQDVPMRETMERVKKFMPLFKPPIHNPGVHYLRVPAKTCPPLSIYQSEANHNSSHDIVVVYKSGLYNFESRQEIRRLYNLTNRGLNIHVVFSIGIPSTSRSHVFSRDGFEVELKGRAGDKLKKHASNKKATRIALEQELSEHCDLLVGNFEDTYFNLTLKMYHTYQWAARFCQPYKPVFVFIDDDYAFNTEKLVKFIKSKKPAERDKFSYGLAMAANPVHRANSNAPQWAFSKKEIPWPRHVKQLLGIYNIYGYPLVNDMALGMHFTKPIPIDDTWLAMVQWKLGMKLNTLDGMILDQPALGSSKCKDVLFAPTTELKRLKCKL